MQRGGWGFLSSQQVAGSLPPICVSLSPTDEVRGLDGVEAKLSPKFLNGQPRKYLSQGRTWSCLLPMKPQSGVSLL